jgi:hypothetical protein
MANNNLNAAKAAKKDEFYTQLEDINNELRHYREHFRGKTVLCNCDDPRVSNFFTYFAYNFEFLGLKRLITTCYKNQDIDLFSQNQSEQAVYLIYEGDKNGVPLTREFDFIRTYVKLMQLRFTDKVRIAVDLPAEVPDKTVPPLMLISFIENAFKHGVSYNKPSFIHMALSVQDNRICFNCINSKNDIKHEVGGVGMTNVVKRLDLIYGDQYTLRVDDKEQYSVCLTVPAHHVGTAAATKNKNLSQIY